MLVSIAYNNKNVVSSLFLFFGVYINYNYWIKKKIFYTFSIEYKIILLTLI